MTWLLVLDTATAPLAATAGSTANAMPAVNPATTMERRDLTPIGGLSVNARRYALARRARLTGHGATQAVACADTVAMIQDVHLTYSKIIHSMRRPLTLNGL